MTTADDVAANAYGLLYKAMVVLLEIEIGEYTKNHKPSQESIGELFSHLRTKAREMVWAGGKFDITDDTHLFVISESLAAHVYWAFCNQIAEGAFVLKAIDERHKQGECSCHKTPEGATVN